MDLRTEEEKWRAAVIADFKKLQNYDRLLAGGLSAAFFMQMIMMILILLYKK